MSARRRPHRPAKPGRQTPQSTIQKRAAFTRPPKTVNPLPPPAGARLRQKRMEQLYYTPHQNASKFTKNLDYFLSLPILFYCMQVRLSTGLSEKIYTHAQEHLLLYTIYRELQQDSWRNETENLRKFYAKTTNFAVFRQILPPHCDTVTYPPPFVLIPRTYACTTNTRPELTAFCRSRRRPKPPHWGGANPL